MSIEGTRRGSDADTRIEGDAGAPVAADGRERRLEIVVDGFVPPDDETMDTMRRIFARAEAGQFTMTDDAILAMMRARLADLDEQIGACMDAIEDATQQARRIGADIETLRAIQRHLEPHMNADGELGELPDAEIRQLRDPLTEEQQRRVREAMTSAHVPFDAGDEGFSADAIRAFVETTGHEVVDLTDCYETVPNPEFAELMTLPDGRDIRTLLVELGAETTLNAEGDAVLAGGITNEGITSLLESRKGDLAEVNSGNEMLMTELQSRMQQRTAVIQLGSNILRASDEARDTVIGNIR